MRRRTTVARRLTQALLRCVFRLEIEALDRFPDRDGVLVVANHLGWIDSFMLFAGLPMRRRLYFIGDAAATSDTWLKREVIALVGGLIPVDRYQPVGDRTALKHAAAVLRAGSNLVIFPEGEMGEDEGHVLPLRRGVAFLARQTNAPTVVVGLAGTRSLWRGKTLRLRVGATIAPPGSGKEEEQCYLQAVRESLLATLPPAEPRPANARWTWLTTLL